MVGWLHLSKMSTMSKINNYSLMFLPKKCQKFKITLLCFIAMSFAHQHSSLYTSKPITRCLTIAIERKGNISVHYAWERQTDLNTASTSICVHQCIIDPFLMCINTTPMHQAPCLRMHWNQLLLTMHQHWTCVSFDTTHHYTITITPKCINAFNS